MRNKPSLKMLALLLGAMLLTGCATASASAATDTGTGTVTSVSITDTITTSGSLSADQLSALTWGTSGTVDKVNVKVGDTVKSGDVLAILKSSSVPAEIITAQSDLASAQQSLTDLQESQSAEAAAQLAVANAEQAVSNAQTAVDNLNYGRASDALINNTQAQILQAKRTVMQTSDRYRLVQRKPDGDPIKTAAELALTNAQLNLNTLTATYNWYTGKPTNIDADLAKANLATARAQLADAQRSWDILKNGPDPVTIAAAQAKVDAAQATVNNMMIIAPFDGVVLTVQTAAGNPITTGAAAFELVNRNTLKVDTLVDETSIASVAAGDKADITLDLLPNTTLKGKVTVISSIGTTVNGLVKYTVTIALDPTDKPLRFGATANVLLYTSQPHSLLAVPVAAVQNDNQGEYVTLVNTDGSTQRVTVTSGDLTGKLVTLTNAAGLKAGDVVALGNGSTTGTGGAAGGGGGIRLPGGGGGGGGGPAGGGFGGGG
jgi:HlyD family secretion protein